MVRAEGADPRPPYRQPVKRLGLLSLILKSLIKSLMQKSDISDLHRLLMDSPYSCGRFEMRLTSVGLFVQELMSI